VAVGGRGQTLGQEEKGAHQVLYLPLVSGDKLGQVGAGVVDRFCLVLHSFFNQVDKLQPVQLELEG